jgi:endonuclease G
MHVGKTQRVHRSRIFRRLNTPMKALIRLILLATLCPVLVTSCKKSLDVVTTPDPVIDSTSANITSPAAETFETGNKALYDKGYTKLSTGTWLFDDALIATSTLDRKRGTACARIEGTGSISMKFDVTNGAKMIIVANAAYSVDANSTWQLWVSENNGSSYYQWGNTITSSQTLKNDTFIINLATSARLSIRKVSGGINRIDIDDVVISNVVTPPPASNGDDGNLLMGNPSNATSDVSNFNNYLMDKGYYTVSYSRDRGTPNWVSWHLQSNDVGSALRQDDFRADVTLPATWYQVQNTSYTGSGFDRGHNCPSADRTSTVAANSSTFLMTNMIPQAPQNNQQTWANMESYGRTLVQGGSELFIIMGSYGVGGTGSNGTVNTLDNGRVTVPAFVWKVIVVIPDGSNDLSRVSASTRVIAVITPNINTTNSNWKVYRTSVDDIETATGYNLLSNVSTAIQNVIEAKVDNQ